MPREIQLSDPVPVVVDGTTIATRVLEPAGPVSGEVVLCHGTPWSSRVWDRVARDLGRHSRVFLWDMPGYGGSASGPPVAVDLRSQARRFAGLCEAWGLQRPHAVAHDIGGAVALGAHLLHGIEYADLFLWDAVVLDPWGSSFFRLVAEHADVFARLPPELHAALVREYIAGAIRQPVPAEDIDALVRPWLGGGQAAFYRQIAALDPADTRPVASRLGEVRCPTRIGWGSDDPWIPIRQAYELRSRLPGLPEVVELAGVGHLAPVESPDAVSAALGEWLAGSPRRG